MWVKEIRNYIEKKIPIMIAGNKVDLIAEKKPELINMA